MNETQVRQLKEVTEFKQTLYDKSWAVEYRKNVKELKLPHNEQEYLLKAYENLAAYSFLRGQVAGIQEFLNKPC